MGTRTLALALVVMLGSAHAAAQTTEGEFDEATLPHDAAVAPVAVAPEPSVETSVEATLEEASEPVVETPAGYERTAVPHPPTPRQARDAERADATAEVAPVDDPDVELAIAINGLLGFSGTTTPVLATSADLVFALEPRAWIGLGISFAYSEQHSGGLPDMKFVTSSVSVPLIFQYYFDVPHVGAAVPTLRLQLTPGWSESPTGGGIPATQIVTGTAALLAGVTWMATSWLALRIIGGVNGGFGVNVVGPVTITGNVGVQAIVSGVVRF